MQYIAMDGRFCFERIVPVIGNHELAFLVHFFTLYCYFKLTTMSSNGCEYESILGQVSLKIETLHVNFGKL